MLIFFLELTKKHFYQLLLSVFKINDTVNFEDNILYNFSGYQTIFSIQSL